MAESRNEANESSELTASINFDQRVPACCIVGSDLQQITIGS